MKRLYEYEFTFMLLSHLPLALFFPFPIDLIPLAIQVFAFYIWYQINK